MSPAHEPLVPVPPRRPEQPLRLCLDANVWISYLGAQSAGKRGTPAALVDLLEEGSAAGIALQLFMSFELIDTICRVLERDGLDNEATRTFAAYVEGLMFFGPEGLDPSLLVSGRDQLGMHDREDAGVLASCMAAGVELLVTDNLTDFEMADAERFNTQVVSRRDGSTRQLFALIYEGVGFRPIVVLHPVDALEWLGRGERPKLEAVRKIYGSRSE